MLAVSYYHHWQCLGEILTTVRTEPLERATQSLPHMQLWLSSEAALGTRAILNWAFMEGKKGNKWKQNFLGMCPK